MSKKFGLMIALLALLVLFILCPWMHYGEIAALQTGSPNIAANTNKANANTSLAAPSLDFTFENGKYRLSGTLPDEAAKKQVLAKAIAVYGENNIIDEIKVGGVAQPGWLSSALSLIPFTKNGVTGGGLSAKGNSISLIGQVPSQAEKDKIYAEAVKATPNTTINNLLTISGQKALSEDQAQVQIKLNEQLAGKIVEFSSGSDQLTEKGKTVLDELAPILKGSTDNLEIGGHTDNQGNAAKNMDLSKRRAQTVKKYLVSRELEAGRFTTIGFGQEKPIADNNTEAGRQRNRRIEFQVKGGGK